MTEWCARCGSELAQAAGEVPLYCAQCGAPQLHLPDYLRVVTPEMEVSRASTTGMVPPPRPQMVDWRAAIRCGAIVGAVAAVLMTMGLLVDALETMGTLWMLLSGLSAAWLYARLRPRMPMNARAGVRVGLVSGLITVFSVGVLVAAGGVAERFLLHRGATLDAFANGRIGATVAALLAQPGANASFNAQAIAVLESPEGHAGYVLMSFLVDAGFVVGLAGACGALAGTMVRRRSRVGRAL